MVKRGKRTPMKAEHFTSKYTHARMKYILLLHKKYSNNLIYIYVNNIFILNLAPPFRQLFTKRVEPNGFLSSDWLNVVVNLRLI